MFVILENDCPIRSTISTKAVFFVNLHEVLPKNDYYGKTTVKISGGYGMGSVRFAGFSDELPELLRELKTGTYSQNLQNLLGSVADQSRIERICIAPALAFIEAIKVRAGQYHPSHTGIALPGKSLRHAVLNSNGFIELEVPFVQITFWVGDRIEGSPALHLVLSSGGFGIGAGMSVFDAAQRQRYLSAIGRTSVRESLEHAIEHAREGGCFLEKSLSHNRHKYPESDLGAEKFVQYSAIMVRNRNEDYDHAIFSPDCLEYVNARFQALLPLQHWLTDHVWSMETEVA